jgi:hypothetical protein
MTKNIREAIQFATKKEALLAVSVIGWKRSDVTDIDIMGFRLWSIMDEQCSYLTREEFDSLATERVSALTPRTN